MSGALSGRIVLHEYVQVYIYIYSIQQHTVNSKHGTKQQTGKEESVTFDAVDISVCTSFIYVIQWRYKDAVRA